MCMLLESFVFFSSELYLDLEKIVETNPKCKAHFGMDRGKKENELKKLFHEVSTLLKQNEQFP